LAGASSDGLEEAVDGDPYRVQWQAWRRPVPACPTVPGVVVVVPGVALRAWGRPHRTNSGGDGAPAGLTSWFDPTDSREKGSRVQPAPLRGRGTLAVREWAAQCHGADTGHTAQLPAVAGMGFP
jgi:hypothetical protein